MRKNMNSKGNKIILMKLSDGDCIVFSGITQILKILKINDNNYRSIEKLKNHPKFKEKYKFFAYEKDLLNNDL